MSHDFLFEFTKKMYSNDGNYNITLVFRFSINLVDRVDYSFQLYDSETEFFMVHIVIQRSSSLGFKTWNSYSWTNIKFISPMPFADGSTHKLTMVPLTDVMTVS